MTRECPAPPIGCGRYWNDPGAFRPAERRGYVPDPTDRTRVIRQVMCDPCARVKLKRLNAEGVVKRTAPEPVKVDIGKDRAIR